MKPLSKSQIEILTLVGAGLGESWGNVWTHYSGNRWGAGAGPAYQTFVRARDALEKRGLIIGGDLGITITDAGRAALGRPTTAELAALEQASADPAAADHDMVSQVIAAHRRNGGNR